MRLHTRRNRAREDARGLAYGTLILVAVLFLIVCWELAHP